MDGFTTAASTSAGTSKRFGAPTLLPLPLRYSSPDYAKKGSSKYDFVKVRVSLSERHYYVLSRFLLSRVLTAIKVEYSQAIRVALDLKKELVDKELLAVTQDVMETHLFALLLKIGYGEETVRLYKMFSSFHHQRIPLIILIGGTACIGKSSLATQLAERLNLSMVLKTGIINELVHDILRDNPEQPVSDPVKSSSFENSEELLKAFQDECLLVKRGLDTEFAKCFKEGKSIIVEGMHMNPEIYSSMVLESRKTTQEILKEEELGGGGAAAGSEDSHQHHAEDDLPKTTNIKSIVVSFLLTLDDEKLHHEIVTSWVRSNRKRKDRPEAEQIDTSLSNFRKIQTHLIEHRGEFTIVPVNVTSEDKIVESMHSTVLDYMQAIYDQASTFFGET